MQSDEQAGSSGSHAQGSLGILSDRFGLIARAYSWRTQDNLVAIPVLRLEQEVTILMAHGVSASEIFHAARLQASAWEDIAGYVGGSWQLWRNGRPELHVVGFVRGSYTFDVGAAVKGMKELLT